MKSSSGIRRAKETIVQTTRWFRTYFRISLSGQGGISFAQLKADMTVDITVLTSTDRARNLVISSFLCYNDHLLISQLYFSSSIVFPYFYVKYN